jgi:hypothetical protein
MNNNGHERITSMEKVATGPPEKVTKRAYIAQ